MSSWFCPAVTGVGGLGCGWGGVLNETSGMTFQTGGSDPSRAASWALLFLALPSLIVDTIFCVVSPLWATTPGVVPIKGKQKQDTGTSEAPHKCKCENGLICIHYLLFIHLFVCSFLCLFVLECINVCFTHTQLHSSLLICEYIYFIKLVTFIPGVQIHTLINKILQVILETGTVQMSFIYWDWPARAVPSTLFFFFKGRQKKRKRIYCDSII